MPKLQISHSQVIAETLVAHREQEEAAADGYCFYAQEASEFAAASLRAVSKVFGCGGEYGIVPHTLLTLPVLGRKTNESVHW